VPASQVLHTEVASHPRRVRAAPCEASVCVYAYPSSHRMGVLMLDGSAARQGPFTRASPLGCTRSVPACVAPGPIEAAY
jgi:hypothetical protein